MRPGPDTLRLTGATVRIDHLPPEGRRIALEPPAAEREALAIFLELSAVEAMKVALMATKFRGGIRVQGNLKATIVQPSVVTFEPVRQDIDEAIDRVFLPDAEKGSAATPGAEVFIDLEGEDLPDPLEGPEADLSDLIIETLALAVDLYPRAEGETIADIGAGLDPPPESPFAALRSLKDRGGKE